MALFCLQNYCIINQQWCVSDNDIYPKQQSVLFESGGFYFEGIGSGLAASPQALYQARKIEDELSNRLYVNPEPVKKQLMELLRKWRAIASEELSNFIGILKDEMDKAVDLRLQLENVFLIAKTHTEGYTIRQVEVGLEG